MNLRIVANVVVGFLITLTWAGFLAFCWWLVFDTDAFGSEDRRTAAIFMAFLTAVFLSIALSAVAPSPRGRGRLD